ncbi:ChbG/HpnK family deacetylase [Aquitalea sp. LB_tupeE]|uniref:ChbG/HpnK family deacetylase n=1 Tax=Aquitalea sp. LB_tupeE TaxID=2748078 RepID=UPI0015C07B20|nr:ChbG/HpnK family deacetylase [Aquitalea sp. LB_tupeE]NWK76885.1 ChbG/HpnK family deacetylase [Aquitalea sp. LB_tupeE]
MTPRRLTLCADDYAQSPAISQGILALLQTGRLSATSVMTQSPHWPHLAAPLRELAQQADIGLHFNLTHDFANGPQLIKPLSHWLLLSQLRCLSRTALRDSLLQQIDLFSQHFGRLPDFIDGHQHVHAFPVIRDALFDAIAQCWTGKDKPYVRAPDRLGHPGDSRLKAMVLQQVCRGFAASAEQKGLRCNQWFAGLYALQPEAGFAGLMQQWLNSSPDGALMMCHPGLPADDASDPIAAARAVEYQHLDSQAFAADCLQAGVELGGFRH